MTHDGVFRSLHMRYPPGCRSALNRAKKGVEEGPRDRSSRRTFCHPWKYSSWRFIKESSVRAAREPGPPPDHDFVHEDIWRERCRRRQADEKKVERWWTDFKPSSTSSENPTVGITRVSASVTCLITTSSALCRNGDLDGPRGLQI